MLQFERFGFYSAGGGRFCAEIQPTKALQGLQIGERGEIVSRRSIKTATEKLSAAMSEIINSGALDKLDKNGEFHEISYSRMGGFGEETLARQLFESLKAKGFGSRF